MFSLVQVEYSMQIKSITQMRISFYLIVQQILSFYIHIIFIILISVLKGLSNHRLGLSITTLAHLLPKKIIAMVSWYGIYFLNLPRLLPPGVTICYYCHDIIIAIWETFNKSSSYFLFSLKSVTNKRDFVINKMLMTLRTFD